MIGGNVSASLGKKKLDVENFNSTKFFKYRKKIYSDIKKA